MTIEQSAQFDSWIERKSFKCKIKHIPMKRIFDLAFSLCVIFFGLPVFLLIALAVRLTSKGKVIYSHERIGRGGKRFQCYKFRTMHPDADQRLTHLLREDPAMAEEWKLYRKLKSDPRLTSIGSFLRKTSLDELPQFFNVIKGDLSVVGPRPVMLEEIQNHFGVKANKILSIRPGITGIWQVSGRSDASYENRLELDEQYVNNRTLFLDLQLIFRTLPCMVFSKGAY